MLSVGDLSVDIAGQSILDGVSFELPDRAVLSVLGPSGSGKTTLLRSIAGLQTLSRGSIHWNGIELNSTPVERRNFGLMFQDYALFPHRSVGDNVAFGLKILGRPRDVIELRVDEVLDWVGLPGYRDRRIAGLSGGEQQRVALARALAPSPRLLMLDEPLGSLDRTLRERLISELREILVDHQITAIYVTHDQEEAFTIGDELMVLREGRVAQAGKPEEVYRSPRDEWTARFLGFRNVFTVDVAGGTATAPWGWFPVGPMPEGTATVVVPPDELALEPGGSLKGSVVARAFRGGHYLLRIAIDNGPTVDVEAIQDAPRIGSRVGLAVKRATILTGE